MTVCEKSESAFSYSMITQKQKYEYTTAFLNKITEKAGPCIFQERNFSIRVNDS